MNVPVKDKIKQALKAADKILRPKQEDKKEEKPKVDLVKLAKGLAQRREEVKKVRE